MDFPGTSVHAHVGKAYDPCEWWHAQRHGAVFHAVINSEFGRPGDFDSGGGRGHQSTAFSVVLAGGGLRHQGAFGATDELSKKVVEKAVSVPDLFATILATMQIDSRKNLYEGDRPVPVTDGGKVVSGLLAWYLVRLRACRTFTETLKSSQTL